MDYAQEIAYTIGQALHEQALHHKVNEVVITHAPPGQGIISKVRNIFESARFHTIEVIDLRVALLDSDDFNDLPVYVNGKIEMRPANLGVDLITNSTTAKWKLYLLDEFSHAQPSVQASLNIAIAINQIIKSRILFVKLG